MVSKPLHVKRFKKALADYQQSDRHVFPSFVHPISTNNSSNWCLNLRENYKNNNNNNIHQLLDDNQRKMIADEAERLANLLPVVSIRKPNGRNNISKDLVVSFIRIYIEIVSIDFDIGNHEFTKRF